MIVRFSPAPIRVMDLLRETFLVHVASPAETLMVSPLVAAVIQADTASSSGGVIHNGLEPVHPLALLISTLLLLSVDPPLLQPNKEETTKSKTGHQHSRFVFLLIIDACPERVQIGSEQRISGDTRISLSCP